MIFAACSLSPGAELTSWVRDAATPGSWHDPGNWTTRVPGSESTALIDNRGTAEIAAGDADANALLVGLVGGGAVVHTAGTFTVHNVSVPAFVLGRTEAANGAYELGGSGRILAPAEYVGYSGTGEFYQYGGTNAIAGNLCLAYGGVGSGTYYLGQGLLETVNEYIGGDPEDDDCLTSCTAELSQDAGTHLVHEALVVGASFFSVGTFNLNDGTLGAGGVIVGNYGTGYFNQNGGRHTVAGQLLLGNETSSEGTYSLSGGELETNQTRVGSRFLTRGVFKQTGGTHTTGGLEVGRQSSSSGSYVMTGGQLAVGWISIGRGWFAQSGDSCVTAESISSSMFGHYEIAGGELILDHAWEGAISQKGGTVTVADLATTYAIHGGSLIAGRFRARGEFTIASPEAGITITEGLSFGGSTELTAVPGSCIHMAGASLSSTSHHAPNLHDLVNLEMVFEGGVNVVSTFEVAGAEGGGFVGNFALGRLTLGNSDVGRVQLVDLSDNLEDGESECLFVLAMEIGVGSSLDLNALTLYVDGDVEVILDTYIGGGNNGRLLDSTLAGAQYLDAVYDSANDWTTVKVIPEPAAAALLSLGMLAMICRRKR